MSENMRIIHISDLHFFQGAISPDLPPNKPETECAKKFYNVISFLRDNKARLNTNKIVITGDITDSGDVNDYKIAKNFIANLRSIGYQAYNIPGNHDYCGLGWLINKDEARRQRFQDYIGYYNEYPQEIDSLEKSHVINWPDYYPRDIDLGSMRLILVDSMQAEMNENTGDHWTQGKFGQNQLSKLKSMLAQYESARNQQGVKVIVCVHHSPFQNINEVDKGGMSDCEDFLGMVSNKIDCLLFGHTTDDSNGVYQLHLPDSEKMYGIPLINCENLQHSNSKIPISVIDLTNNQIEVYQTEISGPPEILHSNMSSEIRITPWVTRSDPVIYNYSDAAPCIKLRSGNRVTITAGGGVQTGGSGHTWKRYVNPSGDNSDRLYFGQIYFPGITSILTPIRNLAAHPQYGGGYDNSSPDKCTLHFIIPNIDSIPETQRYLALSYVDDDYGNNGYWSHDDGTESQCRNVGSAYVEVNIKPIPNALSLRQYINQMKADPKSGIRHLFPERRTKSTKDLLTYHLWTE